MKVGFVGGDYRQLVLLKAFADDGCDVKIYGYDGASESVDSFEELGDCEVLIFPVPTCNGDYIFTPESDKKIHINDLDLKGASLIFYAGGNELLNKKLLNSAALCINYMKNDELAQKNAIATAEGTLKIAIDETDETVFGSKILITGFGKVAKAVAKVFYGMGADITVAARKREALAEAWCEYYKPENFCNLKDVVGDYDIVINTVPSMVIDKAVLRNVSGDALIIDLASKPGGVDFDAAKELDKRVIWALGLPGKVAPVTSGKIIYEVISSIIAERVVDEDEA